MSNPSPIILCGRKPQIATGVKARLLPEFEVIRLCLTSEQAVEEIPAVLSGETTFERVDEIGTNNFTRSPVAVFLGPGYSDEEVERMRAAGASKSSLLWVLPDISKPAPPAQPGPEYEGALVGRMKELMARLRAEGLVEKGGVHLY